MADCTESNKNLKENDGEEAEEWSDSMCIRISMEDNFPSIVKDLTIQKSIINRFLNFYLSGKIQKGLSVNDIIFAVIAIMPFSLDSEEFIWQPNQYCDDGKLFFLTPEDKLKNEIRNVMRKHEHNSDQNKLEKHEENNEPNDVTEMFDEELPSADIKFETLDTDISIKSDQGSDGSDTRKSALNESDNENESQSLPLEDLMWYRKKSFYNTTVSTVAQEYGPVTNAAFCTFCNKLLADWDTDTIARTHLKYFFGVVALSLMRCIVKSYQHVMNMFTSTFTRTIAATNHYSTYSPPCEKCVRKTFKALRKVERKTQIMFSKLVVNTFYINYKINSETLNVGSIKNIFNITVLAHTSNYGMDIISLLQEMACRSHNFRKDFEILNIEETAVSWNNVNSFFRKYLCKSAHTPTCHWARIIDREQFKELTCEKNYELAVILAVFIEKESGNSKIWNARWVKSGSNLEKYKQLGLQLYEKKAESPLYEILTKLLEKMALDL